MPCLKVSLGALSEISSFYTSAYVSLNTLDKNQGSWTNTYDDVDGIQLATIVVHDSRNMVLQRLVQFCR